MRTALASKVSAYVNVVIVVFLLLIIARGMVRYQEILRISFSHFNNDSRIGI